jgi:tetratricopeptide (TPR) repeat protein
MRPNHSPARIVRDSRASANETGGSSDKIRREVLPLLKAMAQEARPDSNERAFADRHIAELSVDENPWQAALFARRVLARVPNDERAWAAMALAQTRLGHYRFAQHAFERALSMSPGNPWYAHNLGHLLDVALDRPADALPLLRFAFEEAPENSELAASYAHALARTNQVAMAHRVLSLHAGNGEHARLMEWVESGAPHVRMLPAETAGVAKRKRRGLLRCKKQLRAGLARLPFSHAIQRAAVSVLEKALSVIPLREASSTGEYCAACLWLAHQACGGALSVLEVSAPFGARIAAVRSLSARLSGVLKID